MLAVLSWQQAVCMHYASHAVRVGIKQAACRKYVLPSHRCVRVHTSCTLCVCPVGGGWGGARCGAGPAGSAGPPALPFAKKALGDFFRPPLRFSEKRTAIASVNSNCDTRNGRTQLLRDLMALHDPDVPMHSWGECDRNMEKTQFDKVDLLRRYKFCIAMENSNAKVGLVGACVQGTRMEGTFSSAVLLMQPCVPPDGVHTSFMAWAYFHACMHVRRTT